MRLFIAIELSQDVRDHIIATLEKGLARAEHGEKFRASWVRPEGVHITVKFLGEVVDAEVPAVCNSLRLIEPVGKILLWADRIVCFPPRGPVRVVGVGFGAEVEKLHLLHSFIELECARIGFAKEKRAYSPHATVLRARVPLESHDPLHPSLQAFLSSVTKSKFPGPPFEATEFTLMQSELKMGGSIYTRVAKFMLS